jgi:hypothetical protein
VLSKYGTVLDDVDAAVEAQRRAYAAAHDEQLPLVDRLAVRLAFSYLLQYSAAGRRPSAAALSSAADAVSEANSSSNGASSNGSAAAADGVAGAGRPKFLNASTAAAMVAVRARGRSATTAAAQAAKKGMAMLQKIPLPILSRSTDEEEDAAADAAAAAAGRSSSSSDDEQPQSQQPQVYVLTQAEERLVQVCAVLHWGQGGSRHCACCAASLQHSPSGKAPTTAAAALGVPPAACRHTTGHAELPEHSGAGAGDADDRHGPAGDSKCGKPGVQ